MKSLGAGQNINIRFTDRLLAKIDAYVADLSRRSPGVAFTRSDVVRMAVEGLTSSTETPAAPATQPKSKKPLAKAGK